MTVRRKFAVLLLGASILTPLPSVALAPPDYKQEAIANIDSHAKMVQVMVDTVFSYGEPGFQEFRTGEYLTDILAKNGFKITKGVAGMPKRLDRDLGRGRSADRAGQRRRRSARRLANSGRSQDRAHGGGRAGPWRRPQFRHAAADRRRAGDQGGDGKASHQGPADAVARASRKNCWASKAYLCARRPVQGRGCLHLRPCRQ